MDVVTSKSQPLEPRLGLNEDYSTKIMGDALMPISSYETKFQSFIQMCSKAKASGVDTVVIHHPEVLGDNYTEIVESLNRLAAADLSLKILPPDQRSHAGSSHD